MFEKRRRGYRSLGYVAGDPPHDFELLTDPAQDGEAYWFDQDLPQSPSSQA